jgi:type 1 glutamine amidotransferase
MAKTFLGESPSSRSAAAPAAVVFGNRVAPYHPLGAVEGALRAIFERDFPVRCTEDVTELTTDIGDARLVIAYADTWETPLDEAAAAGLVRFVAAGGGLLVLHNGICWAKNPRVLPLMGAVFAGHPEQARLSYRLTGDHPIAPGQGDFELQEEPYRYDFAPDFSAEVFLHYEHEGRLWPAGWARTHGAGRVVVLQPGHRPAAFENTGYAALVRRSARWCARMI